MFKGRKEAGQKLALALAGFKNEKPVIIAIPRGGVEVGLYVSQLLEAPLSIMVVRKLPFPNNPESGFGAVAEDGTVFINEIASRALSSNTIEKIIKDQKEEIERRIKIIRKGKPLPELKGKTVILVDDGIAMGSTMRTAIMLCRNKGAKKIVVASPVAGPEIAAELSEIADDIVILEKPIFFQAVAQVYENWYDVGDKEVIDIMGKLPLGSRNLQGE